MQNIPQIVRERLKAAKPAVDHPDADILAAFSERSLAELERAQVLDHLARCGECRDVVALALPASETVEATIRPAPTGWLTWPVLRWGFVAAGIIAIASLGILQYQRRVLPQPAMTALKESDQQAPTKFAKNEPLPSPAAAPTEKRDNTAPPAAPAFADTADTLTAPANAKKSARGEAPAAPGLAPQTSGAVASGRNTAPLVAAQLPHGPRLVTNQLQQQNTIQNEAPVPAPPSAFGKQQAAAQSAQIADMKAPPPASQTVAVEVASAAAPVDTQTQTETVDGRQLQDLPKTSPPSNQSFAYARVDKGIDRAKPVVTSAPSQTTNGASIVVSIPRWTINSAGSLQRSFDQGNTWQIVDVNANPASFHGAASVDLSAEPARAKAKDADLKSAPAAITFRAVAANGTDVWAGGSGAALYHSADAGNHWTRVFPSAASVVLTGDVISLDFPDAQHGKVSTSNAEVWTTGDSGQTWQKQ